MLVSGKLSVVSGSAPQVRVAKVESIEAVV